MSFMFMILTALYMHQHKASFLQCSLSDSLESFDDLEEERYAHKQGVICEKWPFYSGGFVKHKGRSSSSSSEEDRHHKGHASHDTDDRSSLLPHSVSPNTILHDFGDALEMKQCEIWNDNYCIRWINTKQSDADRHNAGGCHENDAEPNIITEYQLCLCAHDSESKEYCEAWVCLETPQYPTHYEYSVVVDNAFLSHTSSSSSSSSSSSDESDEDGRNNGDYYRFAKDNVPISLDEAMELQNCWCKEESSNGAFCVNWYCESLAHDKYGCHEAAFSVNDYGWFRCDHDTQNVNSTTCNQWYGFLIDDEERDEYRCVCADDECMVSMCGLREIPLRQNYIWYNFWLAIILWGCLCGCCGTKICFKKKFNSLKCFQCRRCRMCLFYILFGVIAVIHGGVPALLVFMILSCCSLYCAYKCENCKCCSSKCSMSKKWEEMKCTKETNDGRTDTVTTSRDGENSREESVSSEAKGEKVTKSGHVRVTTVDLDEMDGDTHETMV